MIFISASLISPIRHVCLKKKKQLPVAYPGMFYVAAFNVCVSVCVQVSVALSYLPLSGGLNKQVLKNNVRGLRDVTNACSPPYACKSTLTQWRQGVRFQPAPLLDGSKIFCDPEFNGLPVSRCLTTMLCASIHGAAQFNK